MNYRTRTVQDAMIKG